MNKNVRLALWFMAAILVWFSSGLLRETISADSSLETVKPLTKVQVINSEQQLFNPTISLRAKTEANRAVNVLAQVSGRVSKILVEEGRAIKAGEGICQIDAEDRHLKLAQAEASLDNAEIAYRGAMKLKAGGFQSELAISQAKAALASARTQLKRAQLEVKYLQVRAPFDGIVEARPLEVGDFVTPGTLCATVIELNPLKIAAIATEAEVGDIELGDAGVAVFAGKAVQAASITYLARQADPMTQGYRLEAEMANNEQVLRAGLSVQLNIKTKAINGHLVPASTILLNDLGQTVIRVLDQRRVVKSYKVTVVGESVQGIWVVGLPANIVLVTVGQNYIIDGEQVEPSYAINSSVR